MKFQVGDKVSCCGGEEGLILAITEERVLLVIPTPEWHMVKMVVGRDPHEYEGELVWYHGHYYHVSDRDPNEIEAAWADWNEDH